ncbi:NAD(P)H-dependent oxidoreductase [Campylobacter sp. FMV-PI01]|uniref:NAD(P)H-dependent oxidoreductase n=2 Tax=Campylobacter portucalensis TaxID=2608384 RepID=A0A6L5WIS5_9BACT|nr:NAD(P)H-dependent oxidoreductase [Campylobacter portucalensis]
MQNRFSCRKFSDEKISNEVIKEIINLTRLTPSSFGLEPWKFMVVSKKQDLENLSLACKNQPQVANCSHAVIIFARNDLRKKDEFLLNVIKQQGKSSEKVTQFHEMICSITDNMSDEELFNYSSLQVYMTIANLVNIAYAKDVKSCIIGGFELDKLKEFANLSENFKPCIVIALGKSDENGGVKIRQNLDDVLIWK